MIELIAPRPSSTTFAAAIGAAIFAGQPHYPSRAEPYELMHVRGTHSDFMDRLGRPVAVSEFSAQVAAIYGAFAARQERLGKEFEAAIFDDLESLYGA